MGTNTTTGRHAKVAVFHGAGQPLEITSVSVPALAPGQALIRVIMCTICGSDLHTYSGRRDGPTPSVLGHEILGIVEDIQVDAAADHGEQVQTGDRVTWSVADVCGNCQRCRDGWPQKCNSLFKYGHEHFATDPLSGGLSEYCVLRAGTSVVPLPPTLPDSVACPANCATATVAAAMRTIGDIRQRRVLVLGAGLLGLTACAMAKVSGASEVVVCDRDSSRLALAAEFGASRQVQQPKGREYDVVFEMSGSSLAVAVGLNALTIGGRLALVGSVSPAEPVAVDPESVVRRLLTIHGVHNYQPVDLQTAVRFLERHHDQFPFAELVSKKFSLAEAQLAFQYALKAHPIRVAVCP